MTSAKFDVDGRQMIEVPTGGGGGGSGGVMVQAGTQTATSGTVVFSNSNGFTFGMSGSSRITASYTVPSTAGLLSAINLSAGTTSNNLSAAVFSNSNNVSFGLNGSTVTASASVATSLTAINVSAGTTSNNLSAITFSNGSGVSWGLNGSVITASVAAAGGAQTGISAIGVSDTTFSSGTVNFRNSNGISWGSSGAQSITISHDLQFTSNTSAITSNALNTSASRVINIIAATNNTGGGTASLSSNVSFSAANGLTFYTSAGNAIVGSYTVPTQSAQTGISGIQVSDNTYTSGTVTFRNANGISFGSSGANGISASYTVPTVTNSAWTASDTATSLTIARLAFTGSNGITMGLSTTTGGSATLTASYTVPTQSAQTIGGYMGSTQFTVGDSSSSTADARSLSFSLVGAFVSMGWSDGQIVVSSPAGVTFPASAGTQSRNVGGVSLINSNSISWGFQTGIASSQRITASYALGVSAGTQSSATNGLTFSDSNGIQFGYDGSNVTANAGYLSYYENQPWLVATGTQTVGNSTVALVPFNLPLPGSFSYLRMPVTLSSNSTSFASTNTGTAFSGSQFSTVYAVVYQLGAGANSRSLQSVASGSGGISEQLSFSVSGGAGAGTRWSVSYKVTYPSEGASNSTFSTSTAASSTRYDINSESALSGFNGMRYLDIPFANSLSAGAYWLAYGVSSTTSTQSIAALIGASWSHSNWCATQPNQPFGIMGSATNSTNALQVGIGSFTTNAMTTGSIALSQISSSASHMHPYFQMARMA